MSLAASDPAKPVVERSGGKRSAADKAASAPAPPKGTTSRSHAAAASQAIGQGTATGHASTKRAAARAKAGGQETGGAKAAGAGESGSTVAKRANAAANRSGEKGAQARQSAAPTAAEPMAAGPKAAGAGAGATKGAGPKAAGPGAGATKGAADPPREAAETIEDPSRSAGAEPPLTEPAGEEPVVPFALIDEAWLERAYRIGVGSVVLAAASGGRVFGGPGWYSSNSLLGDEVMDIGVGLSDSVFAAFQRSVQAASRVLAPLAERLREPVGRLLRSLAAAIAPTVQPLQERGRMRREEAEAEVAALVEGLIPELTELILERIDLQAVLSQIDVQELVDASLEHVDLLQVMSSMDTEQAIDQMVSEIDLTRIAMEHVDINRVMENAVKQVDMVALVRSQLEGVDLADLLISTPTSLASGAFRQTTRLVRWGGP